jgi:AraC-like DNA-binding protein
VNRIFLPIPRTYTCSMNIKRTARGAALKDLVQVLRDYTESRTAINPYPTAIDGFLILRAGHPKLPSYRLFRPALCITVQGAKWATFGNRRYEYRAGQAMVVTVEMPSSGAVSEASPGKPFLGFVLALNIAMLHEMAEQISPKTDANTPAGGMAGVCVVDLCLEALDCLQRAMRLLETPEAIPLLYPGIQRELCYWLLTGPGGDQVLRAASTGSREHRVIAAIYELKTRFAEPVRVDELAAIAGMSAATFHRQFKTTTAMSPLQYQKQLRLLEARRLMLTSDFNVETAAAQVGYESASQFSREYVRMFGRPPRRDVHALTENGRNASLSSNGGRPEGPTIGTHWK